MESEEEDLNLGVAEYLTEWGLSEDTITNFEGECLFWSILYTYIVNNGLFSRVSSCIVHYTNFGGSMCNIDNLLCSELTIEWMANAEFNLKRI